MHSLPLEHLMEGTPHATQRKISLESFDLVHARRPEVQVFSKLLVQYPVAGQARPGQVVPNNMVILWPEPIQAQWSVASPFSRPARC